MTWKWSSEKTKTMTEKTPENPLKKTHRTNRDRKKRPKNPKIAKDLKLKPYVMIRYWDAPIIFQELYTHKFIFYF